MAKVGAVGYVPQALQAAREEKGWTKADLARHAGLKRQMLTSYEMPGGASPSAERLGILAAALGRSPADFIDPKAQGMAVLRARAGLSQRDVIAKLPTDDLKLTTYQSIESGRVRRLRHSDATALAGVFGTTPEDVQAAHAYDVEQWAARELDG
jgi:transcriptional regulator with XRE-family HTH domain